MGPPGFGGPPPPPPPPGFGPPGVPAVPTGPRKPAVKPKSKMRPLFWTRILLNDLKHTGDQPATIWEDLTEPELPEEFELQFSQKQRAKKEVKKEEKPKTKQVFKALDGKRAQSVGILMGSCKADVTRIAKAVYQMDENVLALETIKSLYAQRATDEELETIKAHLELQKEAPDAQKMALDRPDQFVYDMSTIVHFSKRIECWTFKAGFSEQVFDINEKLDVLQLACRTLQACEVLPELLSLVLACGNFMNGSTTRGQADGFNIEILAKLRDVKNQSNTSTLLAFVVSVYMKEKGIAEKEPPYPLWVDEMKSAAEIKFEDIDADLNRVQGQLKLCMTKAGKVISATEDEDLVQPFKDVMEDFGTEAEETISQIREYLSKCKELFMELVIKFAYKPKGKQYSDVTPQAFFEIWRDFGDTFQEAWKEELRLEAKRKFEAVQKLRQEQKAKTKTKKVKGGFASKLKQKFGFKKKKKDSAASVTSTDTTTDAVEATENTQPDTQIETQPETPALPVTGDQTVLEVSE
eukprot:m.174616 g.174616  ORF g.174616 m.174616 type:complete len:523 (+) comp25280_c0_seq4:786-2354(+)